ncbi:hypothetical protein DFJ77DRAFT_546075 [Powellomyces hirtus]|nr:hypothetical protein DFJ77DRAFT_546075 [Powellomyces hirtus]
MQSPPYLHSITTSWDTSSSGLTSLDSQESLIYDYGDSVGNFDSIDYFYGTDCNSDSAVSASASAFNTSPLQIPAPLQYEDLLCLTSQIKEESLDIGTVTTSHLCSCCDYVHTSTPDSYAYETVIVSPRDLCVPADFSGRESHVQLPLSPPASLKYGPSSSSSSPRSAMGITGPYVIQTVASPQSDPFLASPVSMCEFSLPVWSAATASSALSHPAYIDIFSMASPPPPSATSSLFPECDHSAPVMKSEPLQTQPEVKMEQNDISDDQGMSSDEDAEDVEDETYDEKTEEDVTDDEYDPDFVDVRSTTTRRDSKPRSTIAGSTTAGSKPGARQAASSDLNWTRTAAGFFKCPYRGCDKTFQRKFNGSTHYATHFGVRDFSCHMCDRTFTRSYDLKRHCKLHKGEPAIKKRTSRKRSRAAK